MLRKITPVVLSGGSGTRLWPVSREGMAKQLVPLLEGETLLQKTLRRVAADDVFGPSIVVGSDAVRFTIKDQVEAISKDATLIIEPARRDTMAAVLLAAVTVARTDPEAMLAVMPSDHLIENTANFVMAIRTAVASVVDGGVAVIGVQPDGPSSAYGYIQPGAEEGDGVFRVVSFTEKPNLETANELIASGYLWNAGIFCFKAGWLIDHLRETNATAVTVIEDAVGEMKSEQGMQIPGSVFSTVESVSFDNAFMEKTDVAKVYCADLRWLDVGDWNALWQSSDKDVDGNATSGDVVAVASHDNLIRSESRIVCALGVSDLAIIETSDAVMVTHRSKAQDVKLLVAELKSLGKPEAIDHIRSHRPWGWYQTMDLGDRFRVKRIVVKPGSKLSLQKHYHRSEHWVVVCGTAEVTINSSIKVLHENESIYVPIGATHRLSNPGRIPVELIEVQTGTYLEEDDIERIEDDFGRVS